ncbi:MAG: hypothetical protein B5M48_01655 [Candidatus Omnitrophica bacterium 4484_213]|nr:MAG: hypothetical protein B5M48_01655 [Candidatus Omnitrophica bacterium 4484_213]
MKKALGLIEVCISIAIITIILASIVNIYTQGYRNLRKSRVNTAVYNLAKGFMEDYSDWSTLISLTGSDPPASGTYTDNPTVSDPFDPITLNNITYTPTLDITDGPTNPNLLKQLNVSISWVEGGITKTFVVTTLKANY